ncbi:hypothetical protein GGS21DRAFT_195771 [Xylaria nigripes]|nr:hypothetical protein GGS21DRAFT_195771 [Xylaria nigripes]
MATPQSTTSGDAPKNNLEQITFRFCSECSNMLYPKEDEDARKLMFTCRTCLYTEESNSSCVFRHVLNNAVGETAGVTQDVGSDPTVCGPVSSHPSDPHDDDDDVTAAGGSTTSASTPHADFDPALCLICGYVLLQCTQCDDPASLDEYNDFVTQHCDHAISRWLRFIEYANLCSAVDKDVLAAIEERFASCDRVTIPGSRSLEASPEESPEESLSQYLPFEWTLDPEEDPPEALGVESSAFDCPLLDC